MKQLKDGDIDEITAKIYSRPRKKLNFSTPDIRCNYKAQNLISSVLSTICLTIAISYSSLADRVMVLVARFRFWSVNKVGLRTMFTPRILSAIKWNYEDCRRNGLLL
jgi:hypothetical protein